MLWQLLIFRACTRGGPAGQILFVKNRFWSLIAMAVRQRRNHAAKAAKRQSPADVGAEREDGNGRQLKRVLTGLIFLDSTERMFAPFCQHDRIAKEGVRFTDWYGQNSCTAGRLICQDRWSIRGFTNAVG
jgi:hypothetical protein